MTNSRSAPLPIRQGLERRQESVRQTALAE